MVAADRAVANEKWKYGPHLEKADHLRFVPLAFETFGAMAEESRKALTTIYYHFGVRHGMIPSKAIPHCASQVSAALQHKIAAILSGSNAVVDPALCPDEVVY